MRKSANSSIDAFMNENEPPSELVQTFGQYDTEQNKHEQRDLVKMQMQLPARLKDVSHPHVKQCVAEFSDKITEKFEKQLADSVHYTAKFMEEDDGYYIVFRNGHEHNPRKAVWDSRYISCLFECVCLTRKSSQSHCRHISKLP